MKELKFWKVLQNKRRQDYQQQPNDLSSCKCSYLLIDESINKVIDSSSINHFIDDELHHQ